MGGLIFLYELKLLPYDDVVPLTWFFIILASISFLMGILSVISGRKLFSAPDILNRNSNVDLPVFADDGKALRYSILFFSAIALFVALQRWYVLINIFGSIPAVLVNASIVYRMNVKREIEEFIPILPAFVYVAVFLAGIYTAYKRKFTFLSFLPFIGIVLKELTYFGRAELLLTLMEFAFSFFLFRHLLNDDRTQRFKFSTKNALIASTFLLLLLVSIASFIRVSRGNYENYVGASRQLNQLKDNPVLTPSIYLYLSSDVGVLNKYVQSKGEDTHFGENTFFIFYMFLSKIGIMPRPSAFQKGYYIPMWTNTGTYIRELHADFGIIGISLGPFLIGFIITWLWYKFYLSRSLYVFAFLVYMFLIIGFSFLVMVTRVNQWYFSLFFILIYIPFLERLAQRNLDLRLQGRS